jgi:hypothetical protein
MCCASVAVSKVQTKRLNDLRSCFVVLLQALQCSLAQNQVCSSCSLMTSGWQYKQWMPHFQNFAHCLT